MGQQRCSVSETNPITDCMLIQSNGDVYRGSDGQNVRGITG